MSKEMKLWSYVFSSAYANSRRETPRGGRRTEELRRREEQLRCALDKTRDNHFLCISRPSITSDDAVFRCPRIPLFSFGFCSLFSDFPPAFANKFVWSCFTLYAHRKREIMHRWCMPWRRKDVCHTFVFTMPIHWLFQLHAQLFESSRMYLGVVLNISLGTRQMCISWR